LTYTDLAGHTQTSTKQYANLDTGSGYGTLYNSNVNITSYTNTNYLYFDLNQNPLLRKFSPTTDPISSYNDWFQAFPIRTYSASSGNTQFSGMSFAIMDHWAGVDSGYNFVKIV
jgi:hypothetical protein